jgi:1A family penicillin-binding protein
MGNAPQSFTTRIQHRGRKASATVRRLSRKARPSVVVLMAAALSAIFWLGGGLAAALAYDVATGLPSREALGQVGDMARATLIYDRKDDHVFTVFREQRFEVPLTAVSQHMVDAIVSVEDQRFFHHRGVDGVRVIAAALTNLREGRAAQGGSTITQQLARQSYLSRQKTFRRKLTEVLLAVQLERSYTKAEILELYLNKAYFGDGLYGVEAAARGYFGKPASDLSIAEAALLAGLVQSPSSYAPTAHPDRALARRSIVLQAMLANGKLTAEQLEVLRGEEVILKDSLLREEPYGLHYKEQVRRQLADMFGLERVNTGGLRVYTTFDLPLQQSAEALVEESLAEIEKRRGAASRGRNAGARAGDEVGEDGETGAGEALQAALVAIEPATGHVRAMVGGRDFATSSFNRAVQAWRQPGSAFKPLVFAAALEAGYTPATLIDRLDEPIDTPEGAWTPEDEQSSAPAMTMRTALRTSSNRAAVRLLEQVGFERALGYAQTVGIGALPSVPSLALGAGEVTLLSLAAAFLPFANEGMAVRPTLIRRVEDHTGAVLYSSDEPPRRVIAATTAFLMAQMLTDVIDRGTANRARRLGFRLPAAGKTGTTNEFRDAWFVGFTPKLLTGVWIGFDQPQTIVRNGYAGEIAVPLWARFMMSATKGEKPAQFSRPHGIVTAQVCRLSGQRPAHGCSEVSEVTPEGEVTVRSYVGTEYFKEGTQPRLICALHSGGSILAGQTGIPIEAGGEGQSLVAPPAAVGEQAASGEEQPKRRGFWARLFGLGGKDAEEKKNEQKKKNEKQKEKQNERQR